MSYAKKKKKKAHLSAKRNYNLVVDKEQPFTGFTAEAQLSEKEKKKRLSKKDQSL